MQEIFLKELKEHGDISFPFAFYHVNSSHPRYVMETHWHDECEICRVLDGELHVTIDGKSYTGRGKNGNGDIFIFNPGSVHSAEPVNCVYECMVFDLNFLLRERSLSNTFLYSILYDQRKFTPYIPYSNDDADGEESIFQSVNKLFAVIREQKNGYELKTFGLMYYLLGIFEHRNLFFMPDKTGDGVSRVVKMRLALSYIHRNYKKHISLKELSDLLELTPPSVVRLFRDIINRKPMEYINSYRIQCAMELLKDPKQSVTAVAFECGFSDVSYFTKVFKKFARQTPRDFIRGIPVDYSDLAESRAARTGDTADDDFGDAVTVR
ncbi:AraC family transcriptional regulator [Anaerobiospirillum sp. NML120449]|uniref:AraC family transcriptional regulator n=1 Tax=Anaerobiospirillum sp. NML120449 TaxID=2932817 RepID=UPI001FF424D7|nr:AraC family transcriptional regulator [Anaerobiospirillum sp. NML120449]MCK0525278.1 AraC family transcriptional regulator [Anaerobiospirillum sp. NML120449]